MLVLAFDTATEVATSALVADGVTLAERVGSPHALLAAVDELLAAAARSPRDLTGIAVGTGPGSFTGTRVGLAVARGLALSLGLPVAGVSTLDALAAAHEHAFPVVDARRGEVFVPGPVALRPEEVEVPRGAVCLGDGARRYRDVLESHGAEVPPDDSELHLPRASLHAALATSFGPVDEVVPLYVRAPDADRWMTA